MPVVFEQTAQFLLPNEFIIFLSKDPIFQFSLLLLLKFGGVGIILALFWMLLGLGSICPLGMDVVFGGISTLFYQFGK